MARSDVSICNGGLIGIGEDTITSLTEDTKPARLCNQRYEQLRNSVLRAAKWNFALKRVQLAKLPTTPTFEFSSEFQLPADCLRVLHTDDLYEVYRIEGGVLLSNRSSVMIKYIREITDPTRFDAQFTEALSARIGMALARPLTDSKTIEAAAIALYNDLVTDAKASDSQENGSIEVFEADAWINARHSAALY